MSDDLDLDMEVVEDDELDELGADGASSSEEQTTSETDKEEATAESTGFKEAEDADPVTTRSDSRREDGERSRTTNSTSKANCGQEIFGLGSVPEEWAVSSLPSVVEVEMGSSPPSSTYNEEEQGLPFYQGNADFGHMTPKVSTWCSDPVKTADKDDVLISIRAPVGDLNIADEHCCIGRGLAALRPEEVNGLYLFYALAQRSRWLSRLASGSTFKSVSSADLEKVDLPVPPLPEQRKIASVLYAVDQAIQKTEAIIEQAQRVKRGLMQVFFRTGLVKDRNLEETRIGEIPADWMVIKAGEHLNLVSGAHVKAEHVTTDQSLEPYITGPEDFDLRGIEVSKYTDQPSKFCEPGDILVTVKGSGCGKTAIADRRVCISRQLKALQTDSSLNRNFLFYYLRFKQNFLETLSEGSAIPGLSNSHLLKLDVPLPPEEEQREIGMRLDSIDDLIEKNLGYGSRLKQLKKGLMQDLLTGEVCTTGKAIEVLDEVAAHG